MRNYNDQNLFDYEVQRRNYERNQQKRLEQRRRDNMQAILFLIVAALVIMAIIALIVSGNNSDNDVPAANTNTNSVEIPDDANNVSSKTKTAAKKDNDKKSEHKIEVIDGKTFIDGILMVNKTYSLPSDYNPGLDPQALEAFYNMRNAAMQDNVAIDICSSFRSYADQEQLYNLYASERGAKAADEVSARPGHSEHQTGLAIDVNTTEFGFEDTPAGQWLDKHCHEYGFIIRFPKGKEDITGYDYEPWHIRYVGVENSKKIAESGLCLEEYLGVKSEYKDDPNIAE